ncbi:MAG: hypothetical protein GW839_04505 [Flavobacteriales bacterium]|nr:hypothetical protein [Flavobacteriia bacterium]NCP06727.1 hypothetical protein [Flavobacteriales bacterium]NCP52856.1 hypothetical protein [Flavobacteriales bacterium]NCP59550.1 hypothetical protein [Flavobacteriales bacterium]NCP89871.1 hypothetical protein [Flavobacteriales bacterium]
MASKEYFKFSGNKAKKIRVLIFSQVFYTNKVGQYANAETIINNIENQDKPKVAFKKIY